ncbi:methyl-accepting chemotaxis protein [Rhodoferax mekongensis]|uniref:Methyl-accepting chemotaxis protein n=1 Tax=Rhodoferax mekongensis TaxID=3068341 RepID=A0ABZ0AWQ8_9BURK|nr:methyl-accepting chemotaxis protein [Rhodoferax sp. TBRC 17307]WNO03940.1 methyl-accepting chemotaxis protein [Rhodoferax sp. TBRC 17307]
MKIGTKLGLFIGSFCALVVLVGILGMKTARDSNGALQSVYEDRVIALQKIGQLSENILKIRMSQLEMILNPSPSNIEIKTREYRENLELLNKAWTEYASTKMTEEENARVQEFKPALDKLTAEGFEPIAKAIGERNIDEARGVFVSKMPLLLPKVQAIVEELTEIQVKATKDEYDAASENFIKARAISVLVTLAGCLIATLLGAFLVRQLKRQLGGEPAQVIAISRAISLGDLTTNIDTSKAVDGSLIASMERMQSSLLKAVKQISITSQSVANSSAEIAFGNTDLSSRTESQASALEETAASMEELSGTVKNNAHNAYTASQSSQNAVEMAQNSSRVVEDFVSTMRGIDDSSKKIGEIIGVIDSIAFQTNILALNAAVEAARAGEQGRGFAVVASEVRALAGRSASAAKEIKSLIEVSTQRVDAGRSLAENAVTGMKSAVSAIQNVTNLIQEISHSSNEQSAGINQIGQAVTEMDQVTQQNAALVEEMSASAMSLKEMSQDLLNAISVFKFEQQ